MFYEDTLRDFGMAVPTTIPHDGELYAFPMDMGDEKCGWAIKFTSTKGGVYGDIRTKEVFNIWHESGLSYGELADSERMVIDLGIKPALQKRNIFFETYEKVLAFPVSHYLADKSPMPIDIISPRILTPGAMLLFGGAPKVGKSDFILSWLLHMAAGVDFMGMRPARPLRIFYLQAEIGYHYLRERIGMVDIARDAMGIAENNMVITPRIRMLLNPDGVVKVGNAIKAMGGCDIIAIDPLRNVYDGESENDNAEMMKFLQGRVEALRQYASPETAIILVHHTKKIAKDELILDPFLCFSGASSLRGFYNTGMIMYRPDEEVSERVLACELRDGPPIDNMIIDKDQGRWFRVRKEDSRVAHEHQGGRNDAERARKVQAIQKIVRDGVECGEFHTKNSLSDLLAGNKGLGSGSTIKRILGEMIAQGDLAVTKMGESDKDFIVI